MCRLMMVCNPNRVDPNPLLEQFRSLSRESREYQGHGWGCAWIDRSSWQFHHSIKPVWEDRRSDFPPARVFLVHARSAFQNEGITVENNMPFTDGHNVFVFNGELRGVRIKAEGRIGAEKVFNTMKRFNHGDMELAVRRGAEIIEKRTRYVRAMNCMLATQSAVHACCWFNEDPEYFQMQETRVQGTQVICSEPFELAGGQWFKLPNRSVRTISLSQPAETI